MNVCAGIVLCNPDVERLVKNINAIASQVDKLILVDNASENIDKVRQVLTNECADAGYETFVWIKNAENKGVAGALNQLIDYADKKGYEWLLTLDDDSVCGDKMVAELLTAIPHYEKTAVVSPRIFDRDFSPEKDKINEQLPDTKEIDMCITAGSLTNVKAVIDTGGYDERLFIDHVDHDMCLRLKRHGYRIIKVNTAIINQEFGAETIRRRFLWKLYTQRGYAPFRVYYQTRNYIYMLRKYGKEFVSRPCYYYFHLIFAFFARFLYEPKRISRLKAFIKGYFAGLFMKLSDK
jgi:rhamnosyltransferase